MKYKIYFSVLEVICIAGWVLMGALLAEYYDVKVSSIIDTVVLYVQ